MENVETLLLAIKDEAEEEERGLASRKLNFIPSLQPIEGETLVLVFWGEYLQNKWGMDSAKKENLVGTGGTERENSCPHLWLL